MKAFFIKLFSFFRNFVGTLRITRKGAKAMVDIDSNHDGKTDIHVELGQD